ncbi:site-specific integrase [Saccharopolyspora shandongensis]|nr:site-specific integrase [Saccharopolyspora shandongensis]
MLATGVRIGEALAVQWSEVDLDKGVVHVHFTVVRVKGKGLIRKSTKTECGERTLPLPSWTVEMLKKRHAGGVGLDRPVFPESLGGLRDPSNTRRDLRNARGTTGFAWVTSHAFRKTAATILDAAGLDRSGCRRSAGALAAVHDAGRVPRPQGRRQGSGSGARRCLRYRVSLNCADKVRRSPGMQKTPGR